MVSSFGPRSHILGSNLLNYIFLYNCQISGIHSLFFNMMVLKHVFYIISCITLGLSIVFSSLNSFYPDFLTDFITYMYALHVYLMHKCMPYSHPVINWLTFLPDYHSRAICVTVVMATFLLCPLTIKVNHIAICPLYFLI